MPSFRSELTNVLSHAIAELREPRLLHPAWLPHVDGSALAPVELGEAERDLVRRALVAPVVAALGVSADWDREELRIALDAEGAVLLTRRGEAPHEWMDAPRGPTISRSRSGRRIGRR